MAGLLKLDIINHLKEVSMTVSGFIYGAIIGLGTGWALLTSSPDNSAIGISVGVSLTMVFGFVFSQLNRSRK